MMMSMAGAEEEEEQEEDPPEDVSGIMGGQDTLVIAHSNGVFHHCIQWCESQVSQLFFGARHPPLHRLFQWFSLVQRLWFIKTHVLTLSPDPDLGWQMFHKVISS